MFTLSSKARLTPYDRGRFPGDSLFDRIARTVCDAGCLPRKELFEAWEVARRVRRRFRGGRVVDLCAGHGLLGQIMLLLDDSSPDVLAVDRVLPPSAEALRQSLVAAWPRLDGRVTFCEMALEDVELRDGDVVVSVHACGNLTDRVIERAVTARARVAVMPCCHDLDVADTGALGGWMAGPMAVDAVRATKLGALGWRIRTQTIPDAITPHNRLLMAEPPTSSI